METIKLYRVTKTDGDRRTTGSIYFFDEEGAKKNVESRQGYNLYVGEVKGVRVRHEDDPHGHDTYYLLTNISKEMDGFDLEEVRRTALNRLSPVERVALGLQEDW